MALQEFSLNNEDLAFTSIFDSAALLESAKDLAQSQLQGFAQSQDFNDRIASAFGEGRDVNKLRDIWLTGKIYFPAIEVRSKSELGGAYGAFSQETGKIYLAQELINTNSKALISSVLLEEYGHFVDAQINQVDSAGDEGAIFAALVQGKGLDVETLQALRNEDDHAVINLNGQVVQVEQDIQIKQSIQVNVGSPQLIIKKLANLDFNFELDRSGKFSGDNIVWYGYVSDGSVNYVNSLYFYNGTTTTQFVTKLPSQPQTSGNNIVWQSFDDGDQEIYFYNGTKTTKLTSNNTSDYEPQISGNNIVWLGQSELDPSKFANQVFLYNGTKTTQLTDDNLDKSSLQILGNNIVWLGRGRNFSSTYQVYYYNGITTTQLTNDNLDKWMINLDKSFLQMSGNNIIWRGSDNAIYIYNGTTTTQLTNKSPDIRYAPIMSGNNIVWQASDGNDFEIYYYNGTTTTQLTNNNYDDIRPSLSGNNNLVTWTGKKNNGNLASDSVYYYNGTTTTELTSNNSYSYDPQILNQLPNYAYLKSKTNLSVNEKEALKNFETDWSLNFEGQFSYNGSAGILGNNLVFTSRDGRDDLQRRLYLYNGTTITQLAVLGEKIYQFQVSDDSVSWFEPDANDIKTYNKYTYQISPDLPPIDPLNPLDPVLPTLAIEDLTITEGNSGTKNATFTVTRTGTSTQPITVNYSTANGTATAGNDYTNTSGTLTFATNESTKTITVPIIGDTTFESDETFFVNLTNPSNATITDAQGIGTITNDDVVPPTVSVSNAYVSVNSNQNTVIKFKVTLSKPSNQDVTIAYSTSDKSANSTGQRAAKDYQSIINGTVTFASGETSKEIAVTVFGERGVSDQDLEIFAKDTAYRNWPKEKDGQYGQDVDQIPIVKPYAYDDLGYYVDQFFDDPKSNFQAVGLTSNENFSLKLTSANNATIVDGDAIGTIYDLGKAPILATRGTKEFQDVLSDANPLGVGFDQYRDNQSAVETWLKKVSQSENGGVIFRPNLTGHSLGGALTQLIAYNYTGNLGKVVTFNSPGVNPSGAPKSGITSTTHYITSSDIVSMAGSNYLPGSYVLSDYSSFNPKDNEGLFGVAGTHLFPILSPRVGYDKTNTDFLETWPKKPTPLSQIPNLPSSSLSNFFFTYLPDPDYLAFQVAVGLINPVFSKALTFRGTTEVVRVELGAILYAIKFSVDSVVAISKAASNASSKFSSDKWNKIIQGTKNSLNQPTNNTQLQATSRSVNAFALSISDVSSDIPSDVSSDIPIDVSSDIPIDVSSDIPINVSSDIPSDVSSDIPINVSSDIPSDVSPWDAFSKWTVGIWEASPNWDIQTFSDAIANINTPPGVENPILDQVATEDKLFSLTFADTTFVEIDSNDSLIG